MALMSDSKKEVVKQIGLLAEAKQLLKTLEVEHIDDGLQILALKLNNGAIEAGFSPETLARLKADMESGNA